MDVKIGEISLGSILTAIVVLIVGLVVIKYILKLLNRATEKSKMDKTLMSFIKVFVKVALYFLLIIIVFDNIGVSIISLIAAFSVAGLAVSLAAEGTISNIIGGITLLVTKPFSVGDYISAAGKEGTVLSIGLFYTKVATTDNKTISLPNSNVSHNDLINYSTAENRRVDIKFVLSYEYSEDDVRAAITEIIEQETRIKTEPSAPCVVLNSFLEHGAEYAVKAWTSTEDYWDVYYNLCSGIKKNLEKKGIPLAGRSLTVIDKK